MFTVQSRFLLLTASCCILGISSAQAATLPAGFSETRVATGLSSPTAMAVAPDGRIFVHKKAARCE
jgi:glucose/arabinose dehydrogenase